MRTLVVKRDYGRKVLKDRFRHLDGLDNICVRGLDEQQQRHLARHLDALEADRYDRLVLDLKWELLREQLSALQNRRNLVILEHDAWFNFDSINRYYGRFSDFYHRLQPFTLIVTSHQLADSFREEGLHTVCVPKGYDPELLGDDAKPRDIRLAFVGSTGGRLYWRRNRMLAAFRSRTEVLILRSDNIAGYRCLLNRIRFFLSADVGMNEYMSKNYEALACGCVLVAWRQGAEEEALGLVDGENCLLYRDIDEVLERIVDLENRPEKIARIAAAGRDFVEKKFSLPIRDRALLDAVAAPIPTTMADNRSWWKRHAGWFLHPSRNRVVGFMRHPPL